MHSKYSQLGLEMDMCRTVMVHVTRHSSFYSGHRTGHSPAGSLATPSSVPQLVGGGCRSWDESLVGRHCRGSMACLSGSPGASTAEVCPAVLRARRHCYQVDHGTCSGSQVLT